VLSVGSAAWPVNARTVAPLALMDRGAARARSLPHRADFRRLDRGPGRGEYRLKLAALRDLALELGMRPGDKAVTPAMERTSSEFHRGFLRGLFDADGSVQGSQPRASACA
jgi:ribonucleoside-diphosphate reductase alpha chain